MLGLKSQHPHLLKQQLMRIILCLSKVQFLYQWMSKWDKMSLMCTWPRPTTPWQIGDKRNKGHLELLRVFALGDFLSSLYYLLFSGSFTLTIMHIGAWVPRTREKFLFPFNFVYWEFKKIINFYCPLLASLKVLIVYLCIYLQTVSQYSPSWLDQAGLQPTLLLECWDEGRGHHA